jgi:hypothetical protein
MKKSSSVSFFCVFLAQYFFLICVRCCKYNTYKYNKGSKVSFYPSCNCWPRCFRSINIHIYMRICDNLRSQTLLHNKSYVMNFGHWNYNCAFYYYYLIMKKIYKINKSKNFVTFVRMGNVSALLSNATPLLTRFFAEMSKKRKRCAVVNLENNFSI